MAKESKAPQYPESSGRPEPDRGPEIERGGGPADRAAWFYKTRSDQNGKVLSGLWARAAKHRRKLEAEIAGKTAGQPGPAGSVNWTPIGPSVVLAGIQDSGRITSIVVGPSGSRVYAGAANGGVWLSTNGGSDWAPLDDYTTSPTVFGGSGEADSLAIGAITVRFGGVGGDEVFVGTGEFNPAYDAYFGVGIRHLASGTWSLEATNLAQHSMSSIVIDPDDPVPTHVFAATNGGIFRRPLAAPFLNWVQVTSAAFTNSNGRVSDLIVAGSGATKKLYAAFSGDKVYSSPDGATWTALTGLAGTGRIALAASESNPGVVYALREDGTINRLNGTAFSVVTGLPGSVLFADPQGWYDIAIAVHPTDPNTILVGGDAYAVFKGAITGSPGSFVFPFNAANTATPWLDPTWVGSGIHSDVHSIVFGLNAAGTAHDPNNVWVGSDGGMFHSGTGGGAGTFSASNRGLAITEFAYVAQRADTDAVVFAGAQDNGTPRLLSEQAALERAGGDGGGLAYDPNSAYRVMRQYVRASLDVTTDGGGSWAGVAFPPMTANTAAQKAAAQAESNATGFVAPIASATDGATSVVAFGTNRLWLSTDWGATWATLPTNTNPYVPATPNAAQDVIDGNNVVAIAFASGTRIFAATYNTIWRYDKVGATWSRTAISNAGLPFHIFTALAVEDPVAGSFYATLGSGGVGHVYYYDGAAWRQAMPTTVVDVPTHAVVVDSASPQNVYVGTDVGCWKGIKGAGPSWTWSLFSQGLPESAITHLAIHSPSHLLRAATHGRSAWEIDLSAASGLDPDIYLRANYNDSGRVNGMRAAWIENHLDPTHVNYTLYHWMSADIKVRRSSLAGLPALSSPVNYADFATNIGDYVDSVARIETGDVSGTDRIFVEVHNRSLTPVSAAQVSVLLLVADASAGLPPLPANYALHINAGDTSAAWLAGSAWRFVDPATPYRALTRDLDVRTPQVVEYQLDFSTLGLPMTHDHVCLAAFTTAPGDQIGSANTILDQVTMSDKHIAHRNVHLVPIGSTPGTEPGTLRFYPQTMLLDFHNASPNRAVVDLVFDRAHFPGELALTLPKKIEFADPIHAVSDFTVVSRDAFREFFHEEVGRWFERVGELLERFGERLAGEPSDDLPESRRSKRLASLDRSRIYHAEAGLAAPTIRGAVLPAAGMFTIGITVHVPPGSKPGDSYRLDVIQRDAATIKGGSSYVIAVAKPRRAS
jgi:hypothetical protein